MSQHRCHMPAKHMHMTHLLCITVCWAVRRLCTYKLPTASLGSSWATSRRQAFEPALQYFSTGLRKNVRGSWQKLLAAIQFRFAQHFAFTSPLPQTFVLTIGLISSAVASGPGAALTLHFATDLSAAPGMNGQLYQRSSC